MFDVLDVGASGLAAQRVRMDTIAMNMANSETTRNAAGQPVPYQRRFVIFAPGQANDPTKAGVHVKEIGFDQSPGRVEHDPQHKDADANGLVHYPNVDPTVEMVNMIEASRAYEANITMMEVSKAMLNASLRLIA